MGTVNSFIADAGKTNAVIGGLGTATKAIGAYNAAASQRDSLNYQASIAANNAILDRAKASIADQNGTIAVQNQELKTAQIFGMQRANMAANGVDLGQGSAHDVLTSTELMGARDAAQLETNAMREAWGYKTQANDLEANAAALRSMAGSVSPINAGLTSLVGSAPQVSNAWRTYNHAINGNTPPNWVEG